MALLFSIFLNQILPVFIILGIGALFGHYAKPDVRTLSRIAFYVFSPCLIFVALTGNALTLQEIGLIGLVALIVLLSSAAIGFIVARALRFDRAKTAALILVMLIPNTGNMGLPVILFAFGEDTLARAVPFFTVSLLSIFSLGILVASSGKASIKQAVIEVFKTPVIYALIITIVVLISGIELPLFLSRPAELLGNATIPVMLTLLGVQIAQTRLPENLSFVYLAAGMRLLIGPAIGFGVALLFGLTGEARAAVVTEAAMPIAVFVAVLALEYDTEPALLTGAVVLSTLLSPLTLTPIIALLTP